MQKTLLLIELSIFVKLVLKGKYEKYKMLPYFQNSLINRSNNVFKHFE